MQVKCLAQEHNAVPWLGLEPGLLDLGLHTEGPWTQALAGSVYCVLG